MVRRILRRGRGGQGSGQGGDRPVRIVTLRAHRAADILQAAQQKGLTGDFAHSRFQFRRGDKQGFQILALGMDIVHEAEPAAGVEPQDEPRVQIDPRFRELHAQELKKRLFEGIQRVFHARQQGFRLVHEARKRFQKLRLRAFQRSITQSGKVLPVGKECRHPLRGVSRLFHGGAAHMQHGVHGKYRKFSAHSVPPTYTEARFRAMRRVVRRGHFCLFARRLSICALSLQEGCHLPTPSQWLLPSPTGRGDIPLLSKEAVQGILLPRPVCAPPLPAGEKSGARRNGLKRNGGNKARLIGLVPISAMMSSLFMPGLLLAGGPAGAAWSFPGTIQGVADTRRESGAWGEPYPAPECRIPLRPRPGDRRADWLFYRREMLEYRRCVEAYLTRAREDMESIRDRMDKAIREYNEASGNL